MVLARGLVLVPYRRSNGAGESALARTKFGYANHGDDMDDSELSFNGNLIQSSDVLFPGCPPKDTPSGLGNGGPGYSSSLRWNGLVESESRTDEWSVGV